MGEINAKRAGIVLDDNYAIVVMPIDYALAKIRKDKQGEIYFDPFSFHSTIAKCLQAYIREAIHDALKVQTSISLGDALKSSQEAVRHCENVISHVCPQFEVVENK